MILRRTDWGYYPNAIADFNTSNESFLKLAATHKALKVKHWWISLALFDKGLVGIQPQVLGKPLEDYQLIMSESMSNFWFMLREVVRIPQDGGDPTPFLINRGTFSLFWTFFNNIDIGLLMIRQQGKTIAGMTLAVILLWMLKNTRMLWLTRGSDLRTETILKIKKIRDHLPAYMWVRNKADLDNTEVVTYVERDNKLITAIAQNSKDMALNAARGFTLSKLISDETAFTDYIETMLPAAMAAGTTARRNAELAGVPYGNVFITTPGQRDTDKGAYVYQLFHDGMFWDERLLDIPTRDELIRIIDHTAKGDRTLIHAPFTHRQLGMTDLELYRAMANAGGTAEEKLRDFGLRWTSGSAASPLTAEELETINNSKSLPEWIEIFKSGYVIKWYYSEDEMAEKMTVPHVIALDTSDAIGRDNISMVIINTETLEVAGTSCVNETYLVTYGNWLADVLIKYTNTVLIIERKSSAPGIVDTLLLKLPAVGIEPGRRMFNYIVQDRENNDKDLIEFQRIHRPRDERFYEVYRKFFGFNTTAGTRDSLYGEALKNGVKIGGKYIRDMQLASELLGLVIKNGRIDHKSSGHDDMVIAWLMGVWFVIYGRRLDHYGISNTKLLRRQWLNQHANGTSVDDFEREEMEQRALANEIDEICEQLASSMNAMFKINLERKLRVKVAQLKIDTSQAVTITELRELVRSEKKNSRYLS